MTKLSVHSVAFACAVMASAQAQAASGIWRCGNSYSDKPCADGKPIVTDEAPSVERRRQADEATRRDMEAAGRMQRERLRLEAGQVHQRAVLIGPPPREAPTDIKPSKKKAKKGLTPPDAFVASYANPVAKEKKKKKAKAPADGD